jgi:phenylacetate-CoA ligase
VVFACYCERRGLRFPSLQFVLSSYEYPSLTHRRILRRAFGVPVFNLYGSTETGHLLMETGRGEMRPSLETALLEVLNPDAHGIGELTVTTLTNEFMPLIRYHIGDLVERQERPYHTNYVVQGRAADAFVLPDGRRVTTWQIDQCLADLPGIAHYQLCERPAGEWLLRFVPDVTPQTTVPTDELRRRLAGLLGAGDGLTVQQTDLLVPESSGKFRLGYPAKRNA